MEIIVEPSYQAMSRAAANFISSLVMTKPACVLGLATGSTPIGLYEELVRDYQAGKISFAQVKTFNLDEYLGLEPTHDQSYRYFMQQNLFNHVDVVPSNTHVPSGSANPEIDEDALYEKAIEEAGGIDLQLLGIGHNGHIGFNEPESVFSAMTHTVELTQMTREANSRLFNSIDEVPTHARTMGIGTIMRAREVLLVANGAGKAEIVARAFQGPVTPDVPASILQFHPNVHVVVDAEAAALLK